MVLEHNIVQDIIDRHIAPIIAADSASIELVSVGADDNRVSVRFGGAYRGSPCRGTVLDCVIAPILEQRLGSAVRVEMVD